MWLLFGHALFFTVPKETKPKMSNEISESENVLVDLCSKGINLIVNHIINMYFHYCVWTLYYMIATIVRLQEFIHST